MSSNDMLYYNVRVNEMGPDPRRVKNCSRILKKHDTDNVITNMTLLVYLKKGKKREEGMRRGRERGKRERESQNLEIMPDRLTAKAFMN